MTATKEMKTKSEHWLTDVMVLMFKKMGIDRPAEEYQEEINQACILFENAVRLVIHFARAEEATRKDEDAG